jgi:hypothetical protein
VCYMTMFLANAEESVCDRAITQIDLDPRPYKRVVEAVNPKIWRIARAIGLHVIIWLWSRRMQLASCG